MVTLLENVTGNYRFLRGSAPYSSGVIAVLDYEIVHVALRIPVPYQRGFKFIDEYLSGKGRPVQSLCAIELRSPKPFTMEGFGQFNAEYQALLVERNLLVNGDNPIARTNVAPEVNPPDEPVLSGFSFTVPAQARGVSTFVVAGAGDLRDQKLETSAIVRRGDTSAEGMREKAACVMEAMSQRLQGLNIGWKEATNVNLYTVQSLDSFILPVILDTIGKTTVVHGVNWLYSRPPIIGLEFEMDVRGICQDVRVE